jgi:hypothetical protein
VDWLFDAITRAISPAALPFARQELLEDRAGKPNAVAVVRIDPAALLGDVSDRWIDGQAAYHDRTSRTMSRMQHVTERLGRRLSLAVIWLVVIDLLILFAELFHIGPESWDPIPRIVTCFLIFLSAVLPAAVASLNGIRFQSECKSLGERSGVMRAILHGEDRNDVTKAGRKAQALRLAARIRQAQAAPDTDPGSWTFDVLRLTESLARDFVREVSEWTVLYAKELAEP